MHASFINKNFIIKNPLTIDFELDNVLLMLYQPIIGGLNISLYKTLIKLKNEKSYQNFYLINLLKMNKEEFQEALKLLEEIKLLKVNFIQKNLEEIYVYEIIEPLLPDYFFLNKKFNNFLLSKLGKKYYYEHKDFFLNDKNLINKQENSFSSFDEEKKTTALNDLSFLKFDDPYIYLSKILPNYKEKDKEIIKIMLDKYKLKKNVINCIVNYVIIKNNSNLEPNYVFKISNTLKFKNNFSSAFDHLKIAYMRSKSLNFFSKKNVWSQNSQNSNQIEKKSSFLLSDFKENSSFNDNE
jgi:replication initiation and membrane attachment protein DnaB